MDWNFKMPHLIRTIHNIFGPYSLCIVNSVLPWLGTKTVAAFSGPARCPADAVSIHAKLFSNERVKLPVISVLNGTFLKTLVSFGSSANGLNLYPGPGCSLIARRCPGVSRYRPSLLLVNAIPPGQLHRVRPLFPPRVLPRD